MVHLLCCKMKAFWGFFILVVSASVEDLNNTTTTTPFTSVSSVNDTVALSTPNASTTDTNSSTLAGTTTSNTVGDSSVTSPNTTTTDSSTATRILTTVNTKRTTERTSDKIVKKTTTSAVPMVSPCNTPGFIVAGAAVFLAVIWSSCLCCWYRRKLSRVKSQYDAERALSMREVNGRKISEVKFSVGKADKEFSSVSRNVHGEDEEPEDRTSDLYDVTDPDYEDADGTKSSKAKERSVDEEDSDYDLLNDDDKMKNRESEYACAEFKNSVEDLDYDTYDTTETCNRIKCNKKHENCGGKHLAENLSNSKDETGPQNQTKEMNADSKVYDQVRAEENREEKNKNSEDQATINDILTVVNKTTVENKTAAMDDKTDEDKKTVENMTKVENMATVENQPMIEGDATVTNNTPKEDHASVESKATVEDKSTVEDKPSMVKNQPSVENQAMVESKATVEDKSTDKNKASVENKLTGENKATGEDQVKIEDGALVGDDNGKMDKPCEKTTKSENDNDTKCVTLEYELVKIVQKPNVTQENKQGTPTSV